VKGELHHVPLHGVGNLIPDGLDLLRSQGAGLLAPPDPE
jgi:hypothetical protein